MFKGGMDVELDGQINAKPSIAAPFAPSQT
jgi:hypothetical protein